ncbi:type II toxin-antitoxin system RelE/ParE family toxin [Serratia grimesii]|uniref:type II toxin-antitoxin system RelE/ParE family toxin n=1 Tax=Serratia grimesii TaxID=82995 RepID=UPI0029165357|nr:type II toxin-antitoxin system RelE/ParE family toxin [Serratia grimesii]
MPIWAVAFIRNESPARVAVNAAVTGCLLPFRDEDRFFFMRGFAKNEMDNIASDELVGLKRLAALYLDYSPFRLYQLVNDKRLRRLTYEQDSC